MAGWPDATVATAARADAPSSASPTTSKPSASSKARANERNPRWSSTITTLIGTATSSHPDQATALGPAPTRLSREGDVRTPRMTPVVDRPRHKPVPAPETGVGRPSNRLRPFGGATRIGQVPPSPPTTRSWGTTLLRKSISLWHVWGERIGAEDESPCLSWRLRGVLA